MSRPPMPMMQPQIILLKEGTDSSQGKGQLLSNISACLAVRDTLSSTLGPRGMDKLIVDDKGNVTITNDGATVIKLLDIIHPAAKILVDIARAQDVEVGDGTTSVVLFAGELLKEAKEFIEENLPPRIIIRGYRKAAELAIQRVKDIAVGINRSEDEAELRSMLSKCAETAMNSKLIRSQKEFFTKMVVDAVLFLDREELDDKFIGIKKVPGGAMQDSLFVDGIAFKKTFSYAGFEQQPKHFKDPKILCLNLELELKAEKDNAEIRIDQVEDYQAVVDAEWRIIYEKLEKIVETGSNVVLSKLPIGDLATQYFADRNIFCAGRVTSDDLQRVVTSTGGAIQTTVNDLQGDKFLGTCKVFEEAQVGAERYNFFRGCGGNGVSKTCTLILRGGAEQFIAEVERSLHDAIMIVKRAVKCKDLVAGGGAIEMELSRYLREEAKKIEGKQQLLVTAFAKALELIPRQLCDNAGIDATDVLNKLRQKHTVEGEAGRWYGVDVNSTNVVDTFKSFVWEPSVVKVNMLSAAVEAACLVLSIDETVKNQQSQQPGAGAPPGTMPQMGQRPKGAMMQPGMH